MYSFEKGVEAESKNHDELSIPGDADHDELSIHFGKLMEVFPVNLPEGQVTQK